MRLSTTHTIQRKRGKKLEEEKTRAIPIVKNILQNDGL